jgi:hypothetical protein
MDCGEFRELLGDETDGRLAPADAQRLAAHVAACATCAEERRELASLRAAFRAMTRPAVPQGFRSEVMERLPRGRALSFPRALGWIAAVAAVAVVTVTLVNRSRPGADREVASASRVAAEKPALESAGEDDPRLGAIASDDVEKKAAPSGGAGKAERSLLKQEKSDDAKAPAGEEAAKDTADAPAESEAAAAPAPAAPPREDARRAAAKAPAPEPAPDAAARARAQSEQVLYVVFRDEAAALRFAASLETPPGTEKDKAAAATAVAAPKPPAPTVAKTDALRDDAERKALDVVEEASFTQRRVVARTTVAAPMSDAEFEKALAVAGGRAVPAGDAGKFRELLDGDDETKSPGAALDGRVPSDPSSPAGGTAAAGAKEGAASGGGGGAGGLVARGDAGETRSNAKARRLIVVVVLGPPPPPAGAAPR